jgi:PHD/YefM family antitoxin component YafN of YafNO toxin-antitoxin module
MNTVLSCNQLQENLNATCHQVCVEHTPIVIEMQNGQRMVLVAQEDYLSLLKQNASESVLNAIWNNDDDAEYDKL